MTSLTKTTRNRFRNILLGSGLCLALLGAFGASAQAGDLVTAPGYSMTEASAMPPRAVAQEIAREHGIPLRILLRLMRSNHRVDNYVYLYIGVLQGNDIAAQNLALMPRFMTAAELAWAWEPAIILIDVRPAALTGADVYLRIARASPQSRLVVFTSYLREGERQAYLEPEFPSVSLRG